MARKLENADLVDDLNQRLQKIEDLLDRNEVTPAEALLSDMTREHPATRSSRSPVEASGAGAAQGRAAAARRDGRPKCLPPRAVRDCGRRLCGRRSLHGRGAGACGRSS